MWYLCRVRMSDTLDLRQLLCFTVLAEELHFTRAAARLGISQPRLSLQLRELERRLGTPLLWRTKRRVELTEVGRIVLEQARATVALSAEVAARARLAAEGKLGRIRIGFSEGAALDPLPVHLRAFREAFPTVEVLLEELHPARQAEWLEQNLLDVGYLRTKGTTTLEYEQVKSEPLFGMIGAHHPLAALDVLPLAELAKEPYIMARRDAEPRVFDFYVNLFHRAGVTLTFAPRIDRLTTTFGIVAAGAGFAIVTKATTMLSMPGVVYRPLEGVKDRVPLYLAWRRSDDSTVVRGFVEVNARKPHPLPAS